MKFAAISNCTYCDKDWLKMGKDEDDLTDDIEIKMIHPDIPTSLAEALNIPSLMSRLLDAEELDMGQWINSMIERPNIGLRI